MARIRKKAQKWHVKGTLGVAVLFATGLFVSGAFGGISPLGLTSTGDTGTDASAVSSADTGTSATATDITSSTTDTASSSTDTSSGSTDTISSSPAAGSVPYIVTFKSGVSDAQQQDDIAAANGTASDAISVLHMYSLTSRPRRTRPTRRRSPRIRTSPR